MLKIEHSCRGMLVFWGQAGVLPSTQRIHTGSEQFFELFCRQV